MISGSTDLGRFSFNVKVLRRKESANVIDTFWKHHSPLQREDGPPKAATDFSRAGRKLGILCSDMKI